MLHVPGGIRVERQAGGPGLWVNACGFEKCAPGHQYGPAVRSYYLIHYVFSGEGEYLADGRRYRLGPGEGFVIFPDMVTVYRADDERPWHYGWLGYSGGDARLITRQAGLSRENPVFSAADGEELFSIIDGVQKDISQLRLGSLGAAGGVMRFLARVAQPVQSGDEGDSPAREYFRRAAWYVESSLENGVSVQEVADFVGLCRSQLYRVFRAAAQCSPQEWIHRARMARARRLLKDGALSLEEVARSCGFPSAARLGQAFRRFQGRSPTAYRREASQPDQPIDETAEFGKER